MKRYAQYMRDQVTELLTGYGKIDILWFDFSYPDMTMPEKPWMKGKGKDDWEADKLIALARSLQPGIMIDNRAGIDQDLWTPEQYQPQTWLTDEDGQLVTWEACQTFSGSWGLLPGRDELEVAGNADSDAGHDGVAGRQPAAQCRPDCTGIF